MVLTIVTDPWQVLHDGDAGSLKFGPVASARLHQHFGGVDRARESTTSHPARTWRRWLWHAHCTPVSTVRLGLTGDIR
jgi:hypothetical protein